PTAPAPKPATPAPVVARLSAVHFRGRVALGRRRARLSFTSSAATTLTVTLRRHGHTARTALRVPAGTSRWRVGRRVAGLRLRRGRYRLTLAGPANAATVAFRVR
ncbi:MAG TPA: hypothetical protein VFM58_05930, partial [Solirubrobacteraceae bacterium]|nr:hypothetical protein [Solirubrobacteraceae bacterium]